ncbi:MAG: single-stranded DNA-binding protein, partial [Acaryochloridaceae cyanobacterium CSU_5_19]|nr:single-stranded DNA-binding protein [Acaryochloridaceae cyanobacterium CSU_5_19]
ITVDRPEGFKEKQAELTVSRIHTPDMTMSSNPPLASETSSAGTTTPSVPASQPTTSPDAEPNYDDIPF